MEKEEQETVVLPLAMCRLMKINSNAMSFHIALKDARAEVDRFEQATKPFGLNRRQQNLPAMPSQSTSQPSREVGFGALADNGISSESNHGGPHRSM
jgi:hypothetical protein